MSGRSCMLSGEINNGKLRWDWSAAVRLHRDWSRTKFSHLIRLVHSIAAGERVSGGNACERRAYLTPARGLYALIKRERAVLACTFRRCLNNVCLFILYVFTQSECTLLIRRRLFEYTEVHIFFLNIKCKYLKHNVWGQNSVWFVLNEISQNALNWLKVTVKTFIMLQTIFIWN